jgi:hypothetical protein
MWTFSIFMPIVQAQAQSMSLELLSGLKALLAEVKTTKTAA